MSPGHGSNIWFHLNPYTAHTCVCWLFFFQWILSSLEWTNWVLKFFRTLDVAVVFGEPRTTHKSQWQVTNIAKTSYGKGQRAKMYWEVQRGYYRLPMSLVWSCQESSLSLSLCLAANYRHMLSISTCGSPFESQGPRFLWGAVKVHTLCGTISYSNWDSGPQLWNQVSELCKGTWQASMACSISPGVHHKIVTHNKKTFHRPNSQGLPGQSWFPWRHSRNKQPDPLQKLSPKGVYVLAICYYQLPAYW